jgi:hypothetical protein
VFRDLRGSAAKVLLHLLFEASTGEASTASIMAAIGTSDRKTVYDALEQLKAIGYENPTAWYENHTPPCMKTLQGMYENHTPLYENHTPSSDRVYENHTVADDEVYENHTPSKKMQVVPGALSAVPLELEWVDEPVSLLGRAVEADRLPSDGDINQRTSNFQARRRAQIAVLLDAWQELMKPKYPLQADMAKQWLHLMNDSAEEVYYVLAELGERAEQLGKEYGVAYVRKVLMNKAQEQQALVTTPQGGGQPSDAVFELTEPTEAQKQRWRELRQQFINKGFAPEDFNATTAD